jgi:hypothetical protein
MTEVERLADADERRGIPPKDVEAEQTVVATVLRYPERFPEASFLRPHDFTDADCRRAWAGIMGVTSQWKLPDVPQVADWLHKNSNGCNEEFRTYLELMRESVAHAETLEQNAELVAERSEIRTAMRALAEGRMMFTSGASVKETMQRVNDAVSGPRDLRAERQLIGTLLNHPERFDETRFMEAWAFADDDCRTKFQILRHIHEKESQSPTAQAFLDRVCKDDAKMRADGVNELDAMRKDAPPPEATTLIAQKLQKLYDRRKTLALWSDVHRIEQEQADAVASGETPPLEFMDSVGFFGAAFHVEYLVAECLPAAQNCIIGGREKTLKTSIAADLVISLASATPFLGVFDVPHAVPVAFISGESGKATIQAKAKRICDAKNVDPASLNIHWGFELPQLGNPAHLDWLERYIKLHGLRALLLDPLYLCLLNVDAAANASNIFAMGSALKPLGGIVERTGCSVILAHHFRKGSQTDREYEPARLTQLAQSGSAEWSRSWLLLSRRCEWEPGTPHSLWLNCGGSAGHASQLALDIDEGHEAHPDGRFWSVVTQDARAVRTEKQEGRAEIAAAKVKQKLEANGVGDWKSLRAIAGAANLGYKSAESAVDFLVHKGLMEWQNVRLGGKDTKEYRIKPSEATPF